MKNLLSKDRIAYAIAFVSFVLPKIDVNEIILFGSVARGEETKESDIDIFFNTKKDETKQNAIIKLELERFYKSKLYETWSLKGITNPIKCEIGDLEEWKLKRSIISDGIVVYGKYKVLPGTTKGFVLFILSPIKNIAKRNRVIRRIFGRKEKSYRTEGVLAVLGGRKLSPTTFRVPLEKASEMNKLLSKEKINFAFFEFWTDQF